MARVLLVSNRLPVTVVAEPDGAVRVERSLGGLATGLSRPHEQGGGWWLGWPGDVSGLSSARRAEVQRQLEGLRCAPLEGVALVFRTPVAVAAVRDALTMQPDPRAAFRDPRDDPWAARGGDEEDDEDGVPSRLAPVSGEHGSDTRYEVRLP